MIYFNQPCHRVIQDGSIIAEFTRHTSANALRKKLPGIVTIQSHIHDIKIFESRNEFNRDVENKALKKAVNKLTAEEYNAIRSAVLREAAES